MPQKKCYWTVISGYGQRNGKKMVESGYYTSACIRSQIDMSISLVAHGHTGKEFIVFFFRKSWKSIRSGATPHTLIRAKRNSLRVLSAWWQANCGDNILTCFAITAIHTAAMATLVPDQPRSNFLIPPSRRGIVSNKLAARSAPRNKFKQPPKRWQETLADELLSPGIENEKERELRK